MLYLPNVITGLRIVITPVFAYYALQGQFLIAFYLMLALGISDALDGMIAKTFHLQTVAGVFLDPIADKFSLFIALLTVVYLGWLPVWFLLIIVGRDAAILIRWLMVGWASLKNEFSAPHWSGKLGTLLQFLLLLVLLAEHAALLQPLPEMLVFGWMMVILCASLASLVIYLVPKFFQSSRLSE